MSKKLRILATPQLPTEVWLIIISFLRFDYETFLVLPAVNRVLAKIFSDNSSPLWFGTLNEFFVNHSYLTCMESLKQRAKSLNPRLVVYLLHNRFCFDCRGAKSGIYWLFAKRYCNSCARKNFVSFKALEIAFGDRPIFNGLPMDVIQPIHYFEGYRIGAESQYLITDVVRVLGEESYLETQKAKLLNTLLDAQKVEEDENIVSEKIQIEKVVKAEIITIKTKLERQRAGENAVIRSVKSELMLPPIVNRNKRVLIEYELVSESEEDVPVKDEVKLEEGMVGVKEEPVFLKVKSEPSSIKERIVKKMRAGRNWVGKVKRERVRY